MPKRKRKSPLSTILLLAGVGAGGYALWRMSRGEAVLPNVLLPGQDEASPSGPSNPGTNPRTNTKATTRTTSRTSQAVTVKRNWISARFPLQKGMQGDVVGQLQLMLQKLGRKVTADGKFGAETESALASLNLPTTLSAEAFQAIRAKTTKPVVPPNETPYQKLVRLGYNAGTEIEPAIAIRKELTSTVTSDSTIKRLLTGTTKTMTNIQRAYNALYKSTLVKDLSNLSMSRIRFNEQITRLQALSGLGSVGGRKVIAKVNTLVRSESGALLTVAANRVLGTLTTISNNTVWYQDGQGQLMRVPASDVRIS